MTTHSLNVNKNFNDDNKINQKNDQKQHIQPSSAIQIQDRNDVETVKTFAYAVCREYLSGAWKNIDFDDLVVQRIS